MNYAPLLQATIEIKASLAAVWNVIRDVRRLAEWSPQVESTRLAGDFAEVELGARFTSMNRHGELTWTTHGTVVTFDPGHEIAFRIEENWVIWSFRLEQTDHRTVLVTQRREAPDGISDLSRDLIEAYMGGQAAFTDTMRAEMTETLQGVRATVLAAEATYPE